MDVRQTGYLDDFQRPDEDPLSWAGRWQTFRGNDAGGDHLRLQSHIVEIHTITGGSRQYSYWTPSVFSGDVEVWGEIAGGSDLREGVSLFMHLTNPVSGGSWSGYVAEAFYSINGQGWAIGAYENGVALNGTEVAGIQNASDGAMLFRRVGTELELWSNNGGGVQDRTNWTLVLTLTDSTFNFGFIGLGTRQDDDNPGWSGFGGGQIRRRQIYRYVSN